RDQGGNAMSHGYRMRYTFGLAIIAAVAISGERAAAQDPNSAPNPYKMENNWAKLPDGRKWGAAIGIEADRDGKSIWVFDRCGSNDCGKSTVAPIQKFDSTGKFMVTF